MPGSLEIIVITIVVTALSVRAIVTARSGWGSLPWLQFVRQPAQMGGGTAFVSDIAMMAWWIAGGVVVTLVFALLVKSVAQPVVATVYGLIGYPGEPDDHVGLVTVSVAAIALYLYLVHQVRHIVARRAEVAPASIFEPIAHLPANTPLVALGLRRGSARTAILLHLVSHSVAYLLVRPYEHFYRRYGAMLRGCAAILLTEFGDGVPVEFFRQFAPGARDFRLDEVAGALERVPDQSMPQAATVVLGLVRTYGFDGARRRLQVFAKQNWNPIGSRQEGENRRALSRVSPKIPPPVHLDGLGQSGYLSNCSADGTVISVIVRTRPETNIGPVSARLYTQTLKGEILQIRDAGDEGYAVAVILDQGYIAKLQAMLPA